MDNEDSRVREIAHEIVHAHGQDHISDFASIGVKDRGGMEDHVYNTLISGDTEMIRCEDKLNSTNSGVCFAYNAKTNTMLVFNPDEKDFTHTAYCPDDNENRLQVKIKNVTKDQGYAPEVKRGIYELLPELKKEQELNKAPAHQQQVSEAEQARQERVAKMLEQWRENEKEMELDDDGRSR
jgi:hypothetical protein